jgi:hypothetical protein
MQCNQFICIYLIRRMITLVFLVKLQQITKIKARTVSNSFCKLRLVICTIKWNGYMVSNMSMTLKVFSDPLVIWAWFKIGIHLVVSNHYTVHSYDIVNKRQRKLRLGWFVRANSSAITDITIDSIHSRWPVAPHMSRQYNSSTICI